MSVDDDHRIAPAGDEPNAAGRDLRTDGSGEPLVAEPIEPEDDAITVNDLIRETREIVDSVTTSARRFVDRGRYRKLRITRKGKAVLPDIPLAAVAAVEAAGMVGGGVARFLAVNVGAKFLFDFEVVNEADKYLEIGRNALLDGDLDTAKGALDKAVRIDDTHAEAFLQLGVLSRLRGELEEAKRNLARAKELDELGEVGRRAEEILRAMVGTDRPPP